MRGVFLAATVAVLLSVGSYAIVLAVIAVAAAGAVVVIRRRRRTV